MDTPLTLTPEELAPIRAQVEAMEACRQRVADLALALIDHEDHVVNLRRRLREVATQIEQLTTAQHDTVYAYAASHGLDLRVWFEEPWTFNVDTGVLAPRRFTT